MTYKKSSQGMQSRARRFQMKEVRDVKEDLSKSQQADILRAKKEALYKELAANKERNDLLGQEIHAIQIQLNALGPSKNDFGTDFRGNLLQVIKGAVSEEQWKKWLNQVHMMKSIEDGK